MARPCLAAEGTLDRQTYRKASTFPGSKGGERSDELRPWLSSQQQSPAREWAPSKAASTFSRPKYQEWKLPDRTMHQAAHAQSVASVNAAPIMTDTTTNPPRWAQALLGSSLRPSDFESIPGDLLEEYREVRRPSLGRLRADAWYIKHVLSVLWRVMWPCVIAIATLRFIAFPLPSGWNPSLVPSPGVSLLDALVFLSAGYYGSQRSGRLSTGIVVAGSTSFLGFTMFLVNAAITTPSLTLAPFEKPFIFVIMSILLLIALGFAIVAGTIGAAIGRGCRPPHGKLTSPENEGIAVKPHA